MVISLPVPAALQKETTEKVIEVRLPVIFLPLGLYGPIKPGVYRVFAQFNPNNNLFTSNFTVTVE